MSERRDRVIGIVHSHRHAGRLIVEDFSAFDFAALVGEHELQFAWPIDDKILGLVLVAVRMTTDHNRIGPARHQTRNVRAENWLAKNGATEDVTDGAVRRQPHLLQLELLDALLIGRDRGALDADIVLQNGVCTIDGHLIVGGVAMRQTEIVILAIDLQVTNSEV